MNGRRVDSMIKVTATDVAKLAGVSQSTVSRVFFGDVNVSEKSRQKVMQAAEALGYVPNEFARSLITNQSKLIGIVMKGIENPFYPQVLKQFTEQFKQLGYSVLFIQTNNDEIQKEDIHTLLNYHVAGVVIADATSSLKVIEDFRKHKMPLVLFNRHVPNDMTFSVSTNNSAASEAMTHYLIQKGCKTFAYIAGTKDASTSEERKNGFLRAIQTTSLQYAIHYTDFTYDGGYSIAKKILQQGEVPSAFVVANDVMALGVVDALREQYISVPQQTKVVGFDNIEMASWPGYQLTTWEQPITEMVEQSIQYLLEEIGHYTGKAGKVEVTGQFIERKTT